MEELAGEIVRIVYQSEEDGYTVAMLAPEGGGEPVCIVGTFPAPGEGEGLEVRGDWRAHPRFGRQFHVVRFQVKAPSTIKGILRFLGSGVVRGIGPEMAKRIVDTFGEKTLSVIEDDPARLARVPGIGKKRVKMISESWKETREIRDVMVFLQSHGISPAYAGRILKQYRKGALAVIRNNPYRLAEDVAGIGFKKADAVAASMGFAKNSPARVYAGVVHVLAQAAEDGHVFLPYSELERRGVETLGVEPALVGEAVKRSVEETRLIMEKNLAFPETLLPGAQAVYQPGLYVAETGTAQRLREILHQKKSVRKIRANSALSDLAKRLPFRLADQQAKAVARAVEDKILVITGGPGTGKTTVLTAVLDVYSRAGAKILLAAPTGRAAKRMCEATGHEAKTIHRLLEFNPAEAVFLRRTGTPLECDLLVVDEASMIDIGLMHHLLSAVPGPATLVLVGDVNQLPSVGPGNVLKDVIESGAVPVARLTEIFRQARQSRIVTAAHAVNAGHVPEFEGYSAENDLYWAGQEDPEKVAALVVELVKVRIPRRFGFDPVRDIQVLVPMNKGPVGAQALNALLQKELNPAGPSLTRGGTEYRVGDKVMQVKNDYERDVYNGDLGRITGCDPASKTLAVDFDGREVVYDAFSMDALMLAYATSVHKAQGSEYPAVVVPLVPQHYMLLQRNLLYTAMTRGRRLVVLAGSKKALAMAVRNDKETRRHSLLGRRLGLGAGGSGPQGPGSPDISK